MFYTHAIHKTRPRSGFSGERQIRGAPCACQQWHLHKRELSRGSNSLNSDKPLETNIITDKRFPR